MSLEQLVEAYGLEWQGFKDALDEMDKEAFLELIERAKRHAEAGTKIENPNMFESVVMSILVEHQNELQQVQERLLKPQSKTCPRCGKTGAIEDFYKGNTIREGVAILCQDCREYLFYVPPNNFEKI